MVEVELVLGSLCGLGIVLLALTSWWFYTVPKQYEVNRKQLSYLVRK